MSSIEVNLQEETVAWLEHNARRRGRSPDELLAEIVEEKVAKSLAAPRNDWVPKEKWAGLLRGENCPLCGNLGADGPDTLGGLTVCELKISRLVLMRNQFVRGYCVVVCHEHVKEPYNLEPGKQAAFFDDLMRTGAALEKLYSPEKMNFEILGNRLPHLHGHVKPRYRDDNAGGGPIDQNGGTVVLTAAEYEQQVALIRSALGER